MTELARVRLRCPVSGGTLAMFLGYVVVAIALFHPLIVRLSTHILADDVFIVSGRSDAYNSLWTYWWIQKAVLAGHNFYHCDWVYPPAGANLFFHTHVILPTLLTLPIGALVGPTVGYNCMIILLPIGAACVYCAFLRRTFGFDRATCWLVGGLFGFNPYFVFKLHAHVNLVGAAFWAGGAAVLVHAYWHGRFDRRRGLLFGACVWATFWSSLVEWFALLVVCASIVLFFELERALAGRRFDGRGRVRFFSMALLGIASLGAAVNAPDLKAADIGPFPSMRLTDVLAPPRLSLWGGWLEASAYEYAGSHVPVVFVILAAAGVGTTWRREPEGRRRWLLIGGLALLMLAITVDPGAVLGDLLRRLPMGTGFRVFGRFLPFFYFFLLVPAAVGLRWLLHMNAPRARAVMFGALVLLAFVELVPWQLAPSAVKRFTPPPEVRAAAEAGAFTLIVPRDQYTNRLDTFQVSMNIRVVHLSYLAREAAGARADRERTFPALYPFARAITPAVLGDMARADVRYVLYEDAAAYRHGSAPGEELAEQGGAVLVRYAPAGGWPRPE